MPVELCSDRDGRGVRRSMGQTLRKLVWTWCFFGGGFWEDAGRALLGPGRTRRPSLHGPDPKDVSLDLAFFLVAAFGKMPVELCSDRDGRGVRHHMGVTGGHVGF